MEREIARNVQLLKVMDERTDIFFKGGTINSVFINGFYESIW